MYITFDAARYVPTFTRGSEASCPSWATSIARVQPPPDAIIYNMKTIAITIDDDMLTRVDRLAGSRQGSRNRSRVIRQAVHEYVLRLERMAQEDHEAAVFRRHRERLAQQARALVREQAKP